MQPLLAPSDRDARNRTLAALLARLALGEREALAQVYRLTSAHLFGQLLRINPDRAQAEELLQEVYVAVWRSAGSFDAARSQPLTWLCSVARHRAIDSLRRAQARPRATSPTAEDMEEDMLDTLPGDSSDPADGSAQVAAARQLTLCLGELASEQRQCLALAFYQGLSHAEVAQHLAQPLGSVKSWLRRGLMALKQCLVRRGATGTPWAA